ncbi:hypothetical protein [Devosia aquimaris]|uniref:hypothetical protein n=1 Tax=Devosia aquimaris TaxID=2866214 RepID=UPI001CD13235|nr:hypothetical protein [Devosia sp. CJK-A8-3]
MAQSENELDFEWEALAPQIRKLMASTGCQRKMAERMPAVSRKVLKLLTPRLAIFRICSIFDA